MPNDKPETSNASKLRQMAISRWDNEDGAAPCGPQEASSADEAPYEVPDLSNSDLVQLSIRVIALENLIISLLADASDRQLEQVREMAAYISPRPGFTHHPLTVHAATQMTHLVDRAVRFRS